MRITNNMLSNNLLWNLNSTLSAMERIQRQLSSLRTADKPSENPVAVTKAIRISSSTVASNQYEKNAKDAIEWMTATDTALRDIKTNLDKVRELIISAANDTNTNASGRPEIAAEVREILESVVDAVNTNIGGQYIFGGTNTTEPPCTMYGALDSLTWRDNSSQNFYEVGMGITIGVNTTADEVFKRTGLIDCMQLIYSHLTDTEAKGSTIAGGRDLMTTDANGNYTADLNFMTKGLDIQGMRFLAVDPAVANVRFVQGSTPPGPSVEWDGTDTVVVTYAEHDTARDIMNMWDNIAADEVKARVSVSLIENLPSAIQSQPPVEPNTPLAALQPSNAYLRITGDSTSNPFDYVEVRTKADGGLAGAAGDGVIVSFMTGAGSYGAVYTDATKTLTISVTGADVTPQEVYAAFNSGTFPPAVTDLFELSVSGNGDTEATYALVPGTMTWGEYVTDSAPNPAYPDAPTFCGMLDLTVNGVRKQIYMDGDFTGDPAGMMNHLQAKLAEAYGNNALKVTVDDKGQIQIQDMKVQGFESLILIHGGQAAQKLLAPSSVHGLVDVRGGVDFGVSGMELSVVVNGVRKDVRLTGSPPYGTGIVNAGEALAQYVQDQLNDAFGFTLANGKADLALTVRVNQWGYLEIADSPNSPYKLFNADDEINPSLSVAGGDGAVALFGKNWATTDVVTNGYSLTRGANALYLSHRDELGGSDLEWLDLCTAQVLKGATEAGAKINRLEATISRLTDQRTNYDTQLVDTIGVDTKVQAKLSVDLTSLMNIYNASLSVGSQIILPTLADFLS